MSNGPVSNVYPATSRVAMFVLSSAVAKARIIFESALDPRFPTQHCTIERIN